MAETTTDDKQKKLTRRGFLKWTTALAVAGAGVVGIGAGYGADLLLRPATEKTTTQTTTQTATQTTTKTATSTATSTTTLPGQTSTTTKTVTQPVESLSYVPPLSPEIQNKVDQLISSAKALHDGEVTIFTSCKQNGCRGPACVLKAQVKNGVVVAMEPDDTTISANNPREDASWDNVTKGYIRRQGCPIGMAIHSELYMPSRILYPMKRVGQRGEGKFQRISWTEALDTIASWIKDVKNTYGPNSIWGSTFGLTNNWPGQGFPLSHFGFDAGLTGWGDHSSSAITIPRTMAITGSTSCSTADIFNSKLIILWGNNVTHTEQVMLPYYMRLAREKGIPIIHIDPRYTQTSETLADQWIAIRPGTDIVMMLAMANVMFKENLVNTAFVNQWVEPTGYAKWKDYVLGVAAGPDGAVDRTPEWAEKICGVPAETIRALARLYANSKPSKLLFFCGPPRSDYLNTSRAVIYLTALTGYIMQPGGGEPFMVAGFSDPAAAPMPSINWGRKWSRTVPTLLANLKYHRAILDRPKVDSGQMTQADYNASIGNKSTNPMPNIQMIVYDANYLNNQFDVNERIKAVKAVKYVWGWGWHQGQPTYRYLDLVLPAPIWPFEDMTTSQSNFISGGSPGNHFMYIASPIIDPLGEVRPIEWALLRIGNRLGVDADYNPVLYNKVSDNFDLSAWRQALDAAHQSTYETWMKNAAIAPLNPPSWADFKKSPVYYFPAKIIGPYDPSQTGGKPFAASKSGGLETTDLIEMYNDFLAKPGAADTTFPTYMGNTTFGKLGQAAGPLPMYWSQVYGTFYDPRTQNYPLILLTTESRFRTHSAYFNVALLNGDCYRHACWINPSDAKARSIVDGDLVRVYSNRGEMVIEAYVTSRITPGVVAVHHGGWYMPNSTGTTLNPDGVDRGGAPNLVLEDVEPGLMTIGPSLDKGVCQVEKF